MMANINIKRKQDMAATQKSNYTRLGELNTHYVAIYTYILVLHLHAMPIQSLWNYSYIVIVLITDTHWPIVL